jgi:hypothetical protein
MNKHPMLSVKEAAKLMGCDERWVRERLNQGQLKGEKKKVGLKDKWYVYAGEVEEALEKLKGVASLSSTDYLASAPTAPTVPTDALSTTPVTQTIDVDGWTDEEDEDTGNLDKAEGSLRWLQEQRQALAEIAEEMVRPLMAQLQEKDSQLESRQKALEAANYQLGYLNGRMQDQEAQIKLLPDLQGRAEKAEQLRLEAEAAKARAVELEQSLIEVEKSKQEEVERLLAEKEILEKSQQVELESLKVRIAGLEKSWWRKLFSSGAE